jgi:hypothetical protein
MSASTLAGPQSWKEANAQCRSKGQHLVASFAAEPTGQLRYTGTVPMKTLLMTTGQKAEDYLPDEQEKALIKAKNKVVTSYIIMPNDAALAALYARAVTVIKIDGISYTHVPTTVYEEIALTFQL